MYIYLHQAYYRQTTDESLLRKAAVDISSRYPEFVHIHLKWLFIATWHEVAPYTGNTRNRLTFQSIMATDGTFSFVTFYYNKVEYSNGNNGFAKVGFDLGDGVNLALVQGSCTSAIINVAQLSNMQQPGKFVFRVDNAEISTKNCDDNAFTDGKRRLTVSPKVVSNLARSTVSFQGPCFPNDANVTCVYDTIHKGVKRIDGYVINSPLQPPTAYCETPFFYGYGRYKIDVLVDAFNYSAKFEAYLTVTNLAPDLEVDYTYRTLNNTNWADGRPMGFKWNPNKFDANEELELGIIWIDPDQEDYNDLDVISSRVTNSGEYKTQFKGQLPKSVTADNLVKSLGTFYLRPRSSQSRALSSTRNGVRTSMKESRKQKAVVLSSYNHVSDMYSDTPQSPLCRFKDKPVTNVKPCPCTRAQAETHCSFEKTGGSSWLHPGGDSAFRQTSFDGNSNGAGSQCIYDSNGKFMAGPPGGGTADKYSPTGCRLGSLKKCFKNVFLHFVYDVIPYFTCCKLSDNCKTYYKYRPSGECAPVNDCSGARGTGDPHFTTLDSYQYTFNGNGEFVLMEDALKGEFLVQARMEQLGISVATVFTAFAIRQYSTVVQLQRSQMGSYKIIVLVDGIPLEQDVETYPSLESQIFGPITVRTSRKDWSEVTISLSSGMKFRFRTAFSAMSFILTATKEMKNTGRLRGLLGDFDGDKTNDLKYPNGKVLPPSSNMAAIHDFGMQWILKNATESLFHYGPGKDFDYYYKPYFKPKLTMPSTFSMPQVAVDICGNSTSCLFDYQATGGDLNFTKETAQQNEEFEKTVQVLQQVVPICPGIKKFKNGYFTSSNAFFPGSTLTFYCNDNYILIGSVNTTCNMATLQWSDPVPFCGGFCSCKSHDKSIESYDDTSIESDNMHFKTHHIPSTSHAISVKFSIAMLFMAFV